MTEPTINIPIEAFHGFFQIETTTLNLARTCIAITESKVQYNDQYSKAIMPYTQALIELSKALKAYSHHYRYFPQKKEAFSKKVKKDIKFEDKHSELKEDSIQSFYNKMLPNFGFIAPDNVSGVTVSMSTYSYAIILDLTSLFQSDKKQIINNFAVCMDVTEKRHKDSFYQLI
tara:strand:+ start:1739 stop:2257 length:519 start_codon:yes stop_codon:yes gene_type:complete